MKIVLIILIVIIKFITNTNSQIFNGNGIEIGFVNGLQFDFNLNNITNEKNFKNYAAYDWSFLRFWLRSNDTGFIGYADLHPRVDEFTTYRVLNTQNLIFKNVNETAIKTNKSLNGFVNINQKKEYPGWQIWAELMVPKIITKFVSTVVDESCNVTNKTSIPECATINGTSPNTYQKIIVSNSTETKLLSLPPKNIIDVNTFTFVNYFAIVIQLDKGKIIDAIWDGDRLPEVCKSCDSCIDNQCGVKFKDMGCDIDNGCQLKVMVAWAGRDKNNRPCQSINKLPSNFQKYSATAIKKIGTGLLSDFFYKINNNNNNPNRA